MKCKFKILIFTTDTTHHSYFVKYIKEKFDDVLVICEEKKAKFSYKTNNSFEKDQIIYEKNRWFKNTNFSLKDIDKVEFVHDINNSEVKKIINKNNISLTFVFGTSVLKKKLLKSLSGEVLNFHGGDSEMYRGLDSHLWSIYNEDFNNLVTTLHKVDNCIDTGDIFLKKKIPIKKNMHLKELRSFNTEICIELAIATIFNKQKYKKLDFTKQKVKGKYYSAMPSKLKNICINKFKKFTSNLN